MFGSTTFWRAANRRCLVRWGIAHATRSGLARVATHLHAAFDSMQPFDLRIWNPIRWRRTVGRRAVALGPVRLLPPTAGAHEEVSPWDLFGLRQAHHVHDVAAFHADPEARAATLARVAATGALVHLADSGKDLHGILGEELRGLMKQDPADLDLHAREARSIRMRRLALRRCWLGTRARQRDEKATNEDAETTALGAAALPVVSVLLATRRALFLPRALEAVAKQTYPRIELVLALHGDDFRDIDLAAAGLPRSAKALRLPAQQPLGAVLDAATAASTGALLTKMDDDDAYGPDHVWDLVLAREYSSAQLVGKGLEYVYLAATNKTLHLHAGRGEDYRTMTLAGGTLLISRRDLARAGGWPPLPMGVDKALVERVLRMRGCVYRTHGAEYMMIRRPEGHTWTPADDYFMQKAETTRQGWLPALAGLPADEPLPPRPRG